MALEKDKKLVYTQIQHAPQKKIVPTLGYTPQKSKLAVVNQLHQVFPVIDYFKGGW